MAAYNFARRLKTLRRLTPDEAICKAWTEEPSRFMHNPHHQIPGPNIQINRGAALHHPSPQQIVNMQDADRMPIAIDDKDAGDPLLVHRAQQVRRQRLG